MNAQIKAQLAVRQELRNALRLLASVAIDAVRSEHRGMPRGMAEIVEAR
jgi:hypothetical protein